ncbi:MAG: response regulator transcription factor [Polyangiaceae bacterium]
MAKPNDAAQVIVVADDDNDIRGLLVKALGLTYTVYEAVDGEHARQVLEALPSVEALVCDIMMPQLDGLSLARIMRKSARLSKIPILFLTARGHPLDVVAGINVGARHYVTKPFKVAEVIAKVKAMTRAK